MVPLFAFAVQLPNGRVKVLAPHQAPVPAAGMGTGAPYPAELDLPGSHPALAVPRIGRPLEASATAPRI